MISPQSVAIGAAAVGLAGRESELFRFTVRHSFYMLLVVCVLTMMQAYALPWIIPLYEKGVAAASLANVSTGFIYLSILAIALCGVVLAVVILNRRKGKP